jgi:hypothetical protein
MSRVGSSWGNRAWVVGLQITVFWAAGQTGWCIEPWPSIGPESGAAEVKVLAALAEDTRMEFIETPLEQVVAFLRDQHNINIELDKASLDEIGIGTDVPVTLSLKGVSLRSALQLMLRDLGLTYIAENEVLVIVTPESAKSRPEVRVYNIADLIGEGESAELLAKTLLAIQPAGVPGRAVMGAMPGMPGGVPVGPLPELPKIVPHGRLLIVRDTTVGQHQIACLLTALAAAQKQPPKSN